MARTFTLNGKTYTAKPFGFNMVCSMEEMGLNLETMMNKPMNLLRAYVSVSTGMSEENTGIEMEKHLLAGNNFEAIMEVIGKEIEESDFFRALNKSEEKETSPVPKTTTKKTK